MVSKVEWYSRVNHAWPDEPPIPTADEAVRAVKRIYRFITGKKFAGPVVITSGNRYTWCKGGTFYINPNHKAGGEYGWGALAHDLSHYLNRHYGDGKAHSKQHARLELRIRNEMFKRGYLTGALKSAPPEKSPVDKRKLAYERVLAGIERWESKMKRAKNALAKLNRRRAGFERHMAA